MILKPLKWRENRVINAGLVGACGARHADGADAEPQLPPPGPARGNGHLDCSESRASARPHAPRDRCPGVPGAPPSFAPTFDAPRCAAGDHAMGRVACQADTSATVLLRERLARFRGADPRSSRARCGTGAADRQGELHTSLACSPPTTVLQPTPQFELLPPGNAPAAKWENPSSQGTASASSPKLRAPSMRGRALDAMRYASLRTCAPTRAPPSPPAHASPCSAAGSPGSAPATVAQPRSLPVSSSSHNSLLDAARPQPAGFPPAALERRADEERGVQHEAWINSPLNPQPRLGTSGAAAGWSDRRAP
jgi:hypothetical protein